MQEEDGVKGRVVQAAHGVEATAAQPGVESVVHDLELDLEVAEGRLLQRQENVVQEVFVVEEVRPGVTGRVLAGLSNGSPGIRKG